MDVIEMRVREVYGKKKGPLLYYVSGSRTAVFKMWEEGRQVFKSYEEEEEEMLSLEVPVVVQMYIDIIHGSVVKINHC